MNAEQLNGILARLGESHRALQVLEKLQQVRSALEALAGNPTDGGLQAQYNDALSALNEVLLLPQLNTFTVRESKLIEELDLQLLVGENLRTAVRDAVIGVSMTPRSALDAFGPIIDRTSASLKRINRVYTGLTELGIKQGGPEKADVEVGLYIPRTTGNLTLDQILEEGGELNALVKLSYEAVDGKQSSPEVTYLTSCDYGYLLSVAGNVVMFMLLLIEKGLDIRKKWAEDRELFSRSRELGHDEETVKALEDKQASKRDQELSDAVRVLVHQQTGVDEGRKNEIVTLMTGGIKLFIEKHEHGSYIDVRVGEQPSVPDGDERAKDNLELRQLREKAALLQQIEQVSMRIHALERHGVAQAKTLPPPSGDQKG